jgi:hypothetical protein
MTHMLRGSIWIQEIHFMIYVLFFIYVNNKGMYIFLHASVWNIVEQYNWENLVLKSTVFWDGTPYNLVEAYQCLGESTAFVFSVEEGTVFL